MKFTLALALSVLPLMNSCSAVYGEHLDRDGARDRVAALSLFGQQSSDHLSSGAVAVSGYHADENEAARIGGKFAVQRALMSGAKFVAQQAASAVKAP